MWEYGYTNELYHYGVKGMKWGVRRARGHAGPGRYIGDKRKISGYKKELEILDKGGHLSVGVGKKRQAKFDARDRKALEKGIKDAEQRLAKKKAEGLGDTSKSASSLRQFGARYVNKVDQIDDYEKRTKQERKKIKDPIKRVSQYYKDTWNRPAMTLTGKDTTYGKEYTKGYLTAMGLYAVSTAGLYAINKRI